MLEPNPKLKNCEHCGELKAIMSKDCVHCGGRDRQYDKVQGLWFYFGVIVPISAIIFFFGDSMFG